MILHTQHRKQQTYLMEMQKVNKEKQKLYAAYEWEFSFRLPI